MLSASPISTPAKAASSSSRYHSAELRARRATSRARTRPTVPSPTAATMRAKPPRSCSAALPAALVLRRAAGRALALVLIDDRDLRGVPAQVLGALDEAILPPRALGMALHLGGAGLADVDEG